MSDDPQKLGAIQKVLLALGTGLLMMAGGVGACGLTIVLLMRLGMKYHNNYEYYGQSPARALVFLAGILGFLAPGVAAWYLRNTRRFSLRTLLIVITLIAVGLGLAVMFLRG